MSDQEIIKTIGDQIERLTRDGAKAHTFKAAAEPDDVYYLQHPDGSVEHVIAQHPMPIIFENTADLVKWAAIEVTSNAKNFATRGIYFTDQNIIAIRLDDGNAKYFRTGWAAMRLPLQTGFSFLNALQNYFDTGLPPTEVWQFLRVHFHDALNRDAIALWKKVKLSKNSEGEYTTAAAGDSTCQSVKEHITGIGAIPEELTFKVGVFEIPEVMGLRHSVRCAVKFNTRTGLFTIAALAGELKRAKWDALAALVTELKKAADEAKVPVYRGTPMIKQD